MIIHKEIEEEAHQYEVELQNKMLKDIADKNENGIYEFVNETYDQNRSQVQKKQSPVISTKRTLDARNHHLASLLAGKSKTPIWTVRRPSMYGHILPQDPKQLSYLERANSQTIELGTVRESALQILNKKQTEQAKIIRNLRASISPRVEIIKDKN